MAPERSGMGSRWVFGSVYVAAMAWPWGAYQNIYWGWGLFSIACVALTLSLITFWVRQGRPNIPFDLLWPALLLGGCAAVLWTNGDRASSGSLAAGSGAFLLAVFGATNQMVVYRALALSSLSAVAVAVLTVLAEFNKVFPTFFAMPGGAVGAGQTHLADLLILLAWSTVVASALFVGRRNIRWKLGAWLLPLVSLCCGIAFYALARRLTGDFTAWNPGYSLLAFPALPLVLLCLYLSSRAVARVFVLAEPGMLSTPVCLGGLVLLFSLAHAFIGQFPSTGLCFTFGLITALGVQRTLRDTEAVKTGWAWVLVVPVLAAHAFMLFPGDSRDYVRQAQETRAKGGIQAAEDYLGLVLRRFPGEAAARLEVAKLELEQGQTEAAADTFLAVVREGRAQNVFSKPNEQDLSRFLALLKQRAEGASGIAYERCLVGAGRMEEAVKALRGRVAVSSDQGGIDPGVDVEPLRQALGGLLGAKVGDTLFSGWSAPELAACLKLCGPYCQTIQAPEGVPRQYLPAVLTARPLHDGRMVTVFYPGGQCGRFWRMNACNGETPGEGETWWLDTVLDGDTGEWYAPLAGSADVRFGGELSVSLLEDALLDCGPGAGGWAVLCLLP